MNSKSYIREIMCISGFLIKVTLSFGQATTAGFGNTGVPTDYIGWTTGMGMPLDILNEDDQPLHFYTNAGAGFYNNRKMTIWKRTINGVEHGAVSIHSTDTVNIARPRSILHLGNDYLLAGSIGAWRQWMDVGTFYGKGTDFAYMDII